MSTKNEVDQYAGPSLISVMLTAVAITVHHLYTLGAPALLLGATLLTVYGQWQREGDVMHLVATKMIDHSELLQGLVSKSRNFR